jgi:triosephosphate isomerase
MRRVIIAGNWKMNKTVNEAEELAKDLKSQFKDITELELVICPPFTALGCISQIIGETNIALGAQNMHWEPEGAFTGEVSPLMLKDLGVKFVIIGHSERRQYFGETNEVVNKKLKSALKFGLNPIVCVGENLKEREENRTFEVLTDHIENGLRGLDELEIDLSSRLVIAYEPVWAIGTGRTATPEMAQEAHRFIRKKLAEIFSKEVANDVRIQYGGSVKPQNIKELLKQADIDGALVGGASLEARDFGEIIKIGRKILTKC